MFARFTLIPQLWRTLRLAWRLLSDGRVPLSAKLVLGMVALYLGTPIDIAPDWLPGLGQVDDMMILLAGLNLFIKACPRPLVDEHQARLEGRPAPRTGQVIDGEYRVVRPR